MSKAGGRSALITAAMIVAIIRIWMQVRGKATTPFIQWLVGWGVTFFFLSILAEGSPAAAGSLSMLVVVADFLKNGVSLTNDLEGLISGTQSNSGSLFVSDPLHTTASANTANTAKSKSPRTNGPSLVDFDNPSTVTVPGLGTGLAIPGTGRLSIPGGGL